MQVLALITEFSFASSHMTFEAVAADAMRRLDGLVASISISETQEMDAIFVNKSVNCHSG